jgi:hypothetical protein
MKPILMAAMAAFALLGSMAKAQSFDDDLNTMQEIAKTYGNAWNMPDDKFPEFLQLCKDRDTAMKACSAIYAKYKADLEANNEQGRQLKTMMGHTRAQFIMFMSSAETEAKNFAKNRDMRLRNCDQYMKDAEKSNNHNIFQISLTELDRLERVCQVVQAFAAPNEPAIKEAMDKVTALRAEIKVKSAAIEKATRRVVHAPTEGYSGADKEKHRAAIKSAWMKKWSGDKIVKIVFTKAWIRKSEWNHNGNGNYSKSDMSYLVATVVIQKDAKTATLYPAYVNKNNLSGELSYGVDTKGGSYVNDDIALSKVK